MLNDIDLSRVDLNLLVLFEAVLEELHVGRAAVRMNLTPSAISHGLGRLRRLLNDPLFLRTPKGVVPTARAVELATPIGEILARVRQVVAVADPFDAATSGRAFTIGAPDAVSGVLLPPLQAVLRETAPGVDIRVRQLLPVRAARTFGSAWLPALDEIEAREIDIAIVPIGEVPARFVEQALYVEDFVIAARTGHPFARSPDLAHFCEAQHLLVSLTGDAYGFVDDLLAERGLARRVALTVPNFMMALALLAGTDLIAALPRRLMAMHAERLGLTSMEAPIPLRQDAIRAVASRAAMMDAGVAWLFETLKDLVLD